MQNTKKKNVRMHSSIKIFRGMGIFRCSFEINKWYIFSKMIAATLISTKFIEIFQLELRTLWWHQYQFSFLVPRKFIYDLIKKMLLQKRFEVCENQFALCLLFVIYPHLIFFFHLFCLQTINDFFFLLSFRHASNFIHAKIERNFHRNQTANRFFFLR